MRRRPNTTPNSNGMSRGTHTHTHPHTHTHTQSRQVKEPNLEALCRGKTIYEPPRYMDVPTALRQLLEVEEARGEGAYGPDTRAVGMSRLGAPDQQVGLSRGEGAVDVR